MARIFVCGDIVHHDSGNPFIGKSLQEIIEEADFSIGNLEGTELRRGQKAPSSPVQMAGTINYLSQVGFDLMLLSNNHITDCGREQLQYTINIIAESGMHHIGAGLSYTDAYKPLIKEICGQRFGFVNICEAQIGQFQSYSQRYGYAWTGQKRLLNDISELSSKVDKVVVLVHAGLEHYKMPLPEIRDFYRCLCDVGASVVIGGHPHIAQGFEHYNDSFIAYSLGNFYFPHDNSVYEEEKTSFSLVLDFGKDEEILPQIIHHTQNNGEVEIEKDVSKQIDVDALCQLLGQNYMDDATAMCVDAYDKLCRRLLLEATCGTSETSTFIDRIKDVIRRTILKRKYIDSTLYHRNRLLLRLFENETYRYTIIRALKVITKNEFNTEY